LEGRKPVMDMWVCQASRTTYALSYIDAAEPAQVLDVLKALRAVAQRNLQAQTLNVRPFRLPDMTPNEAAVRLSLLGQLPGSGAVQAQMAFFARGLRVYQASVMGKVLPPDAVDVFFGGLKFKR
jgi:hypothetical protein